MPSKPKVQYPQQHFSEPFWSWRSLDYYKDAGVVHQVTETAIFIATHYEKTYLAVHFANGYFLIIF